MYNSRLPGSTDFEYLYQTYEAAARFDVEALLNRIVARFVWIYRHGKISLTVPEIDIIYSGRELGQNRLWPFCVEYIARKLNRGVDSVDGATAYGDFCRTHPDVPQAIVDFQLLRNAAPFRFRKPAYFQPLYRNFHGNVQAFRFYPRQTTRSPRKFLKLRTQAAKAQDQSVNMKEEAAIPPLMREFPVHIMHEVVTPSPLKRMKIRGQHHKPGARTQRHGFGNGPSKLFKK